MPKDRSHKKSHKPYDKEKTLLLSDTSEDEAPVVPKQLILQTTHEEPTPRPDASNNTFKKINLGDIATTPDRGPDSEDLFTQSLGWPSQDDPMPSQGQQSQHEEPEFISWEDREENDPTPAKTPKCTSNEDCSCIWGEENHPAFPHICKDPCRWCTPEDHEDSMNCKCKKCRSKCQWCKYPPNPKCGCTGGVDCRCQACFDHDHLLNPSPDCKCQQCVGNGTVMVPRRPEPCDCCKRRQPEEEEEFHSCNPTMERDNKQTGWKDVHINKDDFDKSSDDEETEEQSSTVLPKDSIHVRELNPRIGRRIAVVTTAQEYIEGRLSQVSIDSDGGGWIILNDATYENKPTDEYTIIIKDIYSITPSLKEKELIEKIKGMIGQVVEITTTNEDFVEGTLKAFKGGVNAHLCLKDVIHVDVVWEPKRDHKVHIRELVSIELGAQFDIPSKRKPKKDKDSNPPSQDYMTMNSIHPDKSPSQGTQGSEREDRCKTQADLEELQRTINLDPHSRPQTAMSEAMKGENMEDSWEMLRNENFLNIPTGIGAGASPIYSPTSEEATQEENDKTKDFVTEMKNRIDALRRQFGLSLDRDELMKNIIGACSKAEVGQNDDKVRKIKIPLDYDLKSSSSLAALYRYICTHATDAPRRHWATLMQQGFTDPALFEESKVKWHKSINALINANKMERQITPEVLADLVRQAAKDNTIKFSKSMTQLTIKEIPEGLPSVKSLNHIWFKLATDPLSKIPLTWNKAMKDAYPRDSYPSRGFYVYGAHIPPTEEDRDTATNKFVESLATNGAATKVQLGKAKDEVDWLSRCHANAKAFKDKVDDRTWRKLAPVYTKWKTAYPSEQFSNLAYRMFPHLRYTSLDNSMDSSDLHVFNREDAPKTIDEWMQIFATKTVNVPGQSQLQAELHIMQGNWNNILNLAELKSIKPADFRKNGRYSHIYIGRQNRLPAELYRAINIHPPDNPDLNQIVWRFFYKARAEAAKDYHIEISKEDLNLSPWLRLLCDDTVPKTFYFDDIDKVQCIAAHKMMARKGKFEFYGPDCLYHNFVRPMERLFALDMPLSNHLASALRYKDATDDLGLFLMKLIGWNRIPFQCTATTIIEELSKIRGSYSSQFSCANPLDSPLQLQKKVELKDSKVSRYVNESHRPATEDGRELVDRNPFQTPSTEEMDRRIELAMHQITENLQKLEDLNDLNDKQRYQLLHIKDPELRRKACQENDETVDEHLSVKGQIHVSWSNYLRLVEKRGQTKYVDLKVDPRHLENLRDDSTHNLRLKLAREQADVKRLTSEYAQLKKAYDLAINSKFNKYSKLEANAVLSMLSHIQIHDHQIKLTRETEKAITEILAERVQPTAQVSDPSTAWAPKMDPNQTASKGQKRPKSTPSAIQRMYDELNGPLSPPNLNSTMQDSSGEERPRKHHGIQSVKDQFQQKVVKPTQSFLRAQLPEATGRYSDVHNPFRSKSRQETSRPTSRQSTYSRADSAQGATSILGKGQAGYYPEGASKPAHQPRYLEMGKQGHTASFQEGSWAVANPHHKFEDYVTYWPHTNNKNIPDWAQQKISSRQLNLITHHMTLGALQALIDTPSIISLPMNTGHYLSTITITQQVKPNHLPLGMVIEEHTVDRLTRVGQGDTHSVHIPYNFLGAIELTLGMIYEKEFPSLREEKDDISRMLFSSTEQDDYWRVNTAVIPESTNKVWYRAVRFEVLNKTTKVRQRVKVPWIHLSMFRFYFAKAFQELDNHAYLYDKANGPGATRDIWEHRPHTTISK